MRWSFRHAAARSPPPARRTGWQWAIEIAHLTLAACLLSSMMWVLESYGALQWLDGLMLRAAGASTAIASSDPRLLAARPTIIEIDREAYATVFGDQSPLARPALTLLLEQAPMRAGEVLAVDLDLSMSAPERLARAPRPLDATLAALVARGVQVVLAIPDLDERTHHLDWIRARCADGIHFARSELEERVGAVTRIDAEGPTLAVIAVALRHVASDRGTLPAKPSIERAASAADESGAVADLICHASTLAGDDADLQRRIDASEAGGAARHAEQIPLRPAATAFTFLARAARAVRGSPDAPTLSEWSDSNPIVLLGGSYDLHDMLPTAASNLPGLYVHAASIASLQTPAADARPAVVFALDVFIGLALGHVFGWLWLLFRREERAYRAMSDGRLHARRFYGLQVKLLLLWLLPVGIAWLFFYSVRALLAVGWWLNPGPVVIGMFLHSMAIRRDVIEESNESAAHEHRQAHPVDRIGAWRAFKSEHPASLLLHLPLTVLFVVLAALH